jgi:hypothetical protein
MSRDLPLEAIAAAAAFLLLAVAVTFARSVRGAGESRLRRILVPTGFFVFGTLFAISIPMLFVGGPGFQLSWQLLAFVAASLVSIGSAEAVAHFLGAERTRPWLAAGIAVAVLLVYGALALLTDGVVLRPTPVVLVPGLVAAAAAISWWPYLPVPEGVEADGREAAALFDLGRGIKRGDG